MLNRPSAPWVSFPFTVVPNKAEKKENLEMKYVDPSYELRFLNKT